MEAFTTEEIKELLAAINVKSNSNQELENDGSDFITVSNNISGELNYNGSVLVEGKILPGSVINISGFLIAQGGISGATINTGRDVKAPYIEMSKIISQGDLLITSYLLGCYVLCAGSIYCSSGSVIKGGTYSAFYSIQADFFGDPLESKTELYLIRNHSELIKTFKPDDNGDKYLYKIVALQKIWKGTEINVYGDAFSFRGNKDGLTIIENTFYGEGL